MNVSFKHFNPLLVFFLSGMLAAPVGAVEIILEEDLVQGVITKEQLIRVADNAVFMFDASSSMNNEFRDTGKTKLELVSNELKSRMSKFPEIGHNFGIYVYAPWQEIYPMQTFDQEKATAALDAIPTKGSGPTPLSRGLSRIEDALKSVTGRTAVFVFYDGDYTGEIGRPRKNAKKLIDDYNVCFYVISTASDEINQRLVDDVTSLSECSRLIPFERFLNRPEYTSGALIDVRATEEIVTTSETRIAGLTTDRIKFAFDKTELGSDDKSELDQVGEFMSANPESYAVVAGYTDNSGSDDYNFGLARKRAEMVAGYLVETHGIDEDRLVLEWYGPINPLASNDNAEGRAINRRVEIAVGGL